MDKRRCLLVIRVRGRIGPRKDVKETLKYLRVERTNYATLVDDRPAYRGMLQKAKDWITWGEVSLDVLEELLRRRGRLVGDRRLTDENVKETGFNSIRELAEALYRCEVSMEDVKGLKPFFRLRPPSGGYKGGIKRPYAAGGELGYRGEAVNDLVKRMM